MQPILAAIVTHNRLALTQACWRGLCATTTPAEVEVVFVDNGSTDDTPAWLAELQAHQPARLKQVLFLRQNVGTARAINRAWRLRQPDQAALKLDNDAVIRTPGWIPAMLHLFEQIPTLGLLGLKRRDLGERAAHPAERPPLAPSLRSTLYELADGTLFEVSPHVLGTCTLYAPRALERIGDLYQMQDRGNLYGFDDALACLRLKLTGLQSAFLRGFEIEHIDPGESGGDEAARFTRWKLASAGEWLEPYQHTVMELQRGLREPYWKEPEDVLRALV